jgi:hypothetical protein
MTKSGLPCAQPLWSFADLARVQARGEDTGGARRMAERFVAEVAEPAGALTLPPTPPSIHPARASEIASYGIEILGPPGALPS